MAKVATDNKNYTDIASAIREKTGAETTYKPSEMASGVGEVYSKGHADGIQSEYDRFWDEFQQKGTYFIDYPNVFSYYRWNEKCYNPKYPIKAKSGNNMFTGSLLEDTKVDIDISYYFAGQQMFYLFERSRLITIRKIITTLNRSYSRYFGECTCLKNITFEGEIGRSIDFSYSPLTVESMKSVITHLYDYSGTDKEYTYTLSFNSACWEALEADSTAPDGSTWKLYVQTLGWLT